MDAMNALLSFLCTLTHPYLEEKCPGGLVPYTQALLLVRSIRGDPDGYPSFFWK